MCNLYIMYYTEHSEARQLDCYDETMRSVSEHLPEDSDKALPPNPLLESHAKHSESLVRGHIICLVNEIIT